MQPADAAAVRTLFAHVRRRMVARILLLDSAAVLIIAAMVGVVARWHGPVLDHPFPIVAGALLLGAAAVPLAASGRRRLGTLVERRVPSSRNLLLTAGELLADGAPSETDEVGAFVIAQAAALARTTDVASIVPLARPAAACAVAAAGCALLFVAPAIPVLRDVAALPAAFGPPAILNVVADLTPPPYLHAGSTTLHDPSRIEAYGGSQIHLVVRARGDSLAVETLHGRRTLLPSHPGEFITDFTADADGYLALEPLGAAATGPRRLIGVSITPDAPPRVTITAPAHDIKLANGHHTIDVAITASDDVALASLTLRYTRVSGSGERFTFADGNVPLTITRNGPRAWTARARWRLDSLALDAGDMVVYRAVAADARPGAAPTESDAYIAEVLAPGNVAAAGFSIDPDVERYALSEQMVILKTERLAARKATLAADSLADAAADIAAEQRGVRAEFVFMMGGEIGGADDATGDLNEVAEAEGESDLAAGRMLNQGRAALLSAIRSMSRADRALTAPDLADALTQERAALVQLEKTFSHSHLILRALAQRERLDLTRRLTGALTEAVRDTEPATRPPEDPRLAPLRQALAGIAAAAGEPSATPGRAGRTADLAQRILRADPGSSVLQAVARQLSDAATAMTQGRAVVARDLLDRAATALAGLLRADLLAAPPQPAPLGTRRLAGALSDALRAPP